MADNLEPSYNSDARRSTTYSLEELCIIEQKLMAQLEASKQAYVSAKETYQELLKYAKDVGITHPDGGYSLRQALHVQQESLVRFSRDLKLFNEFVLHGRVPRL
jgi:hypothetical protein